MKTKQNKPSKSITGGTCIGTIGPGQPFNAGMVQYFERFHPAPHGPAHVMFARQRNADATTKEITLSFSTGLADGDYSLTPATTEVRVSFVDNSDPTKPVLYSQDIGVATLNFNASSRTFSGSMNVIVINQDNETPKTHTLRVDFVATATVAQMRKLRTPCAA